MLEIIFIRHGQVESNCRGAYIGSTNKPMTVFGINQIKETAEKLKGVTVELSAKAGENGKLFGSVTAQDVANALKMQHHIVIEKKKFSIPDGIKHIGITEVEVKVYPSITAKIKVNVTAEG